MTDSYEIQSSVVEWLSIIQTKNFVDDGMLLRMKITYTIWLHKNTLSRKANGGLHSNKSGSYTLPLRKRSAFKVAMSTLERLQQEAGEKSHVALRSDKHQQWEGTKFIFFMVEMARFMVDSLSFRKPKRWCTKYWMNGVTCCVQYFASFFEKSLQKFKFIMLQIVYNWCRSSATDGVCKDNTSNDPYSRCSGVQQSGYRGNWRSQIAYAWWNRATRRTERQDARSWPPRPRAHEPPHVNWCTRDHMCAWSNSQVLVVMICTPHRRSRVNLCAHLVSSMHAVGVTLRLWHPTSSFSHSLSISFSPSCTSSTNWRAIVTLRPRQKGDGWNLMTNPTSP